ncbi:MAG: HD domain-containing protein [Oscillospiraceae bacterium]|nr:HD domain-containing protein [Oscillospiraceae bacterium]
MMTLQLCYYALIAIASFALLGVYLFRWHKHLDAHMTVIFGIVPFVNLAYLMMYTAPDDGAVTASLKFCYLGGCFLPWVITLCVAGLCNLRVNRYMRLGTFLLNVVFFGLVLTIGNSPLFYQDMVIKRTESAMIITRYYGPAHIGYFVILFAYLLVDLLLILYAYKKLKNVSRRVLILMYIPVPISLLGYALNDLTSWFGFELVPLTYLIALGVYLTIAHRMPVYNQSDMMVESLMDSGETAFVTVDFKYRYLGSNETARTILPALNDIPVDGSINASDALRTTLGEWIDSFMLGRESGRHQFYKKTSKKKGYDRIYAVNVNYLSDGKKNYGYQILLQDDTRNQQYIQLLNMYNTDLQKEVDAKTKRIVEMHDSLILGMATMVESRDNSTGGHIRRTSVGVRILLDEMRDDPHLHLTDSFCKNLIKAAPMHDLGKIAVDDAILKKAGAFTPEERKKMEGHAAEGARIVHEILKETDDLEFRQIAENVAHYHHERVDGLGYPDGLKGRDIPMEARIMSIADFYDALVSKRVYKEAFSFEKANEIILEGMGTRFDPELRWYYEKARPKLEAFYSTAGD